MDAFDLVTGPLRWALGASEKAETEVVGHSPIVETRALEQELHDAIGAIHRACESLERQVTVLERLTDSLPPLAESLPALTESVTRLTDQLGTLLRVTAPVAATERELSRFEHFFGRRRRTEQPVPHEQALPPHEQALPPDE